MARGGFRPGAGRKKGTGKKEKTETKKTLPTPEAEEKKKLREMLKFDKKEARMGKYGTCKFEGCTKKILAGGYCYRRALRGQV